MKFDLLTICHQNYHSSGGFTEEAMEVIPPPRHSCGFYYFFLEDFKNVFIFFLLVKYYFLDNRHSNDIFLDPPVSHNENRFKICFLCWKKSIKIPIIQRRNQTKLPDLSKGFDFSDERLPAVLCLAGNASVSRSLKINLT